MQMFLYNAFKMSVKFVSNLKMYEFDPRVRGLVFFQISLILSSGGGGDSAYHWLFLDLRNPMPSLTDFNLNS